MRELMTLIKVNLNVNFGISAMKYVYLKQKKDIWKPLIFIIAISSLIPSYLLILALVKGLYTGFKMINQESMLLLIGFLGAQLIIFIFGIMYVMSKFYFSDDLKLLIPLPIKPSNIVIAKFITLLVNEYLLVFPIILPFVITFGIKSQVSFLYWLYSMLTLIVLPIIPLGLSTIIVMLFMKYTNIKGKKDLLRVIGMILLIIIILGIQFSIQTATQGMAKGQEQEYISQLIKENNLLIKKSGTAFPPSRWAAMALSSYENVQGLLNLILFIGASLVVFYLMIILGEKIFYKGLIGGQEVIAKKKRLSEEEFAKTTSRVRNPIMGILLREVKILLRTPVFLVNSVVPIFIIPVALLFPFITSGEMADIVSKFYIEKNLGLINLGFIGFVIFISAMNSVSSTTFSREGKQFWISRIIPVKVEYQLIGKILTSILLQLLTIIVMLGAVSIIVKIHLSTIVSVLLLGLLGSIPLIELGMLIDIIRPLLDWDDPQKAMKQNLNVLFAMLIGIIYTVLFGVLVFALNYIKINAIIIYLLLAVIFIILSIILFIIINGTAVKRYREIE